MRASALHRIRRLSHCIGVSDAGPRIASPASEKLMRRIGITLISRCDADILQAMPMASHSETLNPDSTTQQRLGSNLQNERIVSLTLRKPLDDSLHYRLTNPKSLPRPNTQKHRSPKNNQP
ncbi:hypothetical protein PGT21_003378 [Puccinia graminis f. sp. tritici]|uniref:Uncharacterized protein n=1 Tax=Puccinia graminis f. sp. tritici TaxID=56615 RepID=A0A5B0M8U6_PUCGR|nr:hypothetical protein PGT21_003378 [Puccinia graminis f. sp. tritici]